MNFNLELEEYLRKQTLPISKFFYLTTEDLSSSHKLRLSSECLIPIIVDIETISTKRDLEIFTTELEKNFNNECWLFDNTLLKILEFDPKIEIYNSKTCDYDSTLKGIKEKLDWKGLPYEILFLPENKFIISSPNEISIRLYILGEDHDLCDNSLDYEVLFFTKYEIYYPEENSIIYYR